MPDLAGAMDDKYAPGEACFDNCDAGMIWIVSSSEKDNILWPSIRAIMRK